MPPPDVTIVKRALTQSEITKLVGEIRPDREIAGLSPDEWGRFKDIWVAETNGSLAGVCAAEKLSKDLAEIGPLYVLRSHRGRGIGTALFDAAFSDLESKRLDIYVVTANRNVQQMMAGHEMIRLQPWELPMPVHLRNIRAISNLRRAYESLWKTLSRGEVPRLTMSIKHPTGSNATRLPASNKNGVEEGDRLWATRANSKSTGR
jgi:GNAT superfamily N-acetyltransferase